MTRRASSPARRSISSGVRFVCHGIVLPRKEERREPEDSRLSFRYHGGYHTNQESEIMRNARDFVPKHVQTTQIEPGSDPSTAILSVMGRTALEF